MQVVVVGISVYYKQLIVSFFIGLVERKLFKQMNVNEHVFFIDNK